MWVDMWNRSVSVWFLLEIPAWLTHHDGNSVIHMDLVVEPRVISMAAQQSHKGFPSGISWHSRGCVSGTCPCHCSQVAHTCLEPPSPWTIPWGAWGGDVSVASPSRSCTDWTGEEMEKRNPCYMRHWTSSANAANERAHDKWGMGRDGCWALSWARGSLCFDNIIWYLI